jgi:hypothetical protein
MLAAEILETVLRVHFCLHFAKEIKKNSEKLCLAIHSNVTYLYIK